MTVAKISTAARTEVDVPSTVLSVQPRSSFVETPAIEEIVGRALGYLAAGFPVHFRGPAGTGKTTLAMHVADRLGRPVCLIAGDEGFGTSDLVGGQYGYSFRRVVDRYIHSVQKYEEDAIQRWVDARLTTACRQGFTLVYDEFTRSRPEANNVLLGILEERVLVLPSKAGEDQYLKVHPDFRAILTSNPQEYAGVHDAQDALSDRLVVMDLDYYERETEVAIAMARSNLPEEATSRIVDLVRAFRASEEYEQTPTLRASVMIAKVCASQNIQVSASSPAFVSLCLDLLESKTAYSTKAKERKMEQRKMLLSLIKHHCGATS